MLQTSWVCYWREDIHNLLLRTKKFLSQEIMITGILSAQDHQSVSPRTNASKSTKQPICTIYLFCSFAYKVNLISINNFSAESKNIYVRLQFVFETVFFYKLFLAPEFQKIVPKSNILAPILAVKYSCLAPSIKLFHGIAAYLQVILKFHRCLQEW